MIRPGLIRRVKQAFDWETYVRDNHQVKSTASSELRIDCLHCIDRKKKLYINPDKGVFFCQKCVFNSKNFDLFDFVAKSEGITRVQAMTKVIREYGQVTPDDDELEERIQEEGISTPVGLISAIKTLDKLPEGLNKLEEITPQNAKYWKYLVDRGLTKAEILAVGFYCTSLSRLPVYDSNGKYRGDLANRIVVPIYGGRNALVSWQGRLVSSGKDPMKYLSAPESEMAKTVWPYIPPHGTHAVLVEGIYDALAVRRVPKTSAYATFTKKISFEQMVRLKTWGVEEVTLFWDKSDASREMIKAVKDLQLNFKKVYVPWLKDWPADKDAGNMLADSDGSDKIMKALSDVVDTSHDLEFAKWQITARGW